MRDFPRTIGLFEERIKMLNLANSIYKLLPKLHPELNYDYNSFAHIKLGFLREKARRASMVGLCSFYKSNRGNRDRYSRQHGINRILICRMQLNSDVVECIRTIHHEFVHAMLKDFNEPHGPRFQEHNKRIEPYIKEIIAASRGL